PGSYAAVFSKNHAVYVLTTRLPDEMPRSTVHKADGKLIGELPSVAENPPIVPRVQVVKVGKGQGFYAAVVRPRNFDKKKKYPVIVDVYGGPGHVHVSGTVNRWLLHQWLGDQGFIVVGDGGRGTPGPGPAWGR